MKEESLKMATVSNYILGFIHYLDQQGSVIMIGKDLKLPDKVIELFIEYCEVNKLPIPDNTKALESIFVPEKQQEQS